MEIEYGSFQRRIELGEEVDASRATARYERGMLKLILPVVEQP
jgi:HSP20 family molecular chaperone IbpA